MKKECTACLLVIALCVSYLVNVGADDTTGLQVLDGDVALTVPFGWYGGSDGPRTATYFSKQGTIHGGVLMPNQAMIQILVEDVDATESPEKHVINDVDFSQFRIGERIFGEEHISQRSLKDEVAKERSVCSELLLLVSREPVTKTESYRWERFYCFLNSRVAIVRLIAWENDNEYSRYESLARRVVSSIRVIEIKGNTPAQTGRQKSHTGYPSLQQ